MIDRKITFALILAIAVESEGVFAWAGSAAEGLKEFEMRVFARAEMAKRLARVEVQLQRRSLIASIESRCSDRRRSSR